MPSVNDLTQSVLDAVSANNKELVKNSAVLQELKQQQNDAAAQALVAAGAGAGTSQVDGHYQTSEVVRTAAQAEFDRQTKTQNAIALIGADPNKAGTAIANLISKVGPVEEAKIAAQEKVKDTVDTHFLDDPMKWAIGQFTLDGDVKRADAARKLSDDLNNGIHKISDAATVANQMNTLNKSTFSAATVESEARVAEANIQARLAEIKSGNVGKNATMVAAITQMGADQVRNAASALQAFVSGEGLKLAQNEFTLKKRASDQEFEIRAQNFDWAKQDHAGEQSMASTVKIGATSLGVKGLEQMPDPKIIQMLKMKDPKFMDMLKAGLDYQSNGMPVAGETPTEAAANIARNNLPLQPEQKIIKDLYTAAEIKAESAGKNGILQGNMAGLNPAKPAEKAMIVGDIVNKEVEAQRANIDFKNRNNIFGYHGSLESIAETTGQNSIAQTPLYQKVFKPAAIKELDPQLMLSLGTTAVQNKLITQDEFATGMSTIFSGVVLRNNITRQYRGVGIMPQTGYPIRLPTGMFDLLDKYEATSVKDWNRALIKSIISSGVGVGDTNQWQIVEKK